MKTLEFFYQTAQIHFAVNPEEENIMINATEMAKAFNKRIDHFLKADHTKRFLSELEKENQDLFTQKSGDKLKKLENEFPPYGGNSDEKIIQTKGHLGTYMCEELALKFAAWLDPKFELWVYRHIKKVVFGNYKDHWDAHVLQEKAKIRMEQLKQKMLLNPTVEIAAEYFECEKQVKAAAKAKKKAIMNQYKMF